MLRERVLGFGWHRTVVLEHEGSALEARVYKISDGETCPSPELASDILPHKGAEGTSPRRPMIGFHYYFCCCEDPAHELLGVCTDYVAPLTPALLQSYLLRYTGRFKVISVEENESNRIVRNEQWAQLVVAQNALKTLPCASIRNMPTVV